MLRLANNLIVLLSVAGGLAIAARCERADAAPVTKAVNQVQPMIVKIYGAGGLRGLEAYQSGMLISEEGHILTNFGTSLVKNKKLHFLHIIRAVLLIFYS